MGSPPESQQEFRCPACGALATADAAWCGQCFSPLGRPEAGSGHEISPDRGAAEIASGTLSTAVAAAPGTAATAAPAAEPTWPCPACGNLNAVALNECAVCGTSFATLMKQVAAPITVSPEEALRWSLVFPGLGHRRVGRSLDGLTRGVLFGLLGGMAVMIALGGLGSPVLILLFVVYLGFAGAVYIGSALEARNLARGGGLFLPTRQILWAGVIVVMGSLGLLVVSVITSTKR